MIAMSFKADAVVHHFASVYIYVCRLGGGACFSDYPYVSKLEVRVSSPGDCAMQRIVSG